MEEIAAKWNKSLTPAASTLTFKRSKRSRSFLRWLIGKTELKLPSRVWPRTGEFSTSINSLEMVSGTKCQEEHLITYLLLPLPLEDLDYWHWRLMNHYETSVIVYKRKVSGRKGHPHLQNLKFKFNFIRRTEIWIFWSNVKGHREICEYLALINLYF